MGFLLILLIFGGCTAALWFHGFWSNVLTLVNLIFAGLLATNYFEPLAAIVSDQVPDKSFYLDFVVFWLLFCLSFGILRAISDGIGKEWFKFSMPFEMAGRSVFALWNGWLITCIVCMSLHLAPIPANALGLFDSPTGSMFMGLAPDRMWLAFVQSRSRGALSRSNHSGLSHPDDDATREVFDPRGEFAIRYHQRRLDADDGSGGGGGAVENTETEDGG